MGKTAKEIAMSGADPPISKARLIQVKVKPNARLNVLEKYAGMWEARLKAPPVDGRANAELIALVAEHFRCPRNAVTIKSGGAGRIRLVRIEA